ncbi:MAG: hypothetical protein COV01_00320 [Candidatus Taylorbacteria bacterium CG10_big_fil_rev_8_21_14_0_10_41_48]|uniref:Reverse transcriptase domain-containing protein n=1 Tax=Candidatus Taylorbacteria bacterium CG10_big_fil_rev_8_21_14_0_10_41_48 TaxID=1975024 RepID=A0A2M8LCX6_9BACT|nr:MAG: hypothetical protein COV01_00320 [Candidatus Taylorbacteria bacterium CG10_big_fil_rev_8_21_14_0_10_41_48]
MLGGNFGVVRKRFTHAYNDIISVENLLLAWREFIRGKKDRKDIQEFQLRLMDNIFELHRALENKTYIHGGYEAFNINDPKPRSIHKASVRDRLLHHAIYRELYPFFDRTFIPDSFSCRLDKATHKAISRFKCFAYGISKNRRKTVYILKCDIRKFFASIDQSALMEILRGYIVDEAILELLSSVVSSFHSTKVGIGLPLGNLTSQLLVNIYMNKFDQFVKHKLKVKYYIRYADDFVIMSDDYAHLEALLPELSKFLLQELGLSLHPDKVFIKTLASGVDFLGWIHFTDHRVLRQSTRDRMFRKIGENSTPATFASY